MICERGMGPAGNVGVLWRSGESSAVTVGAMCDDILREHVAAQRGDSGDDDAGGDGDSAAAACGARAVGGAEQVQPRGDSDGGVRDADWGNKHFDGNGCELNNNRNVEEPLPRSKTNKLQHVVLLRFPCGYSHPHLFLVHTLSPLCAQRFCSCFVFLLG